MSLLMSWLKANSLFQSGPSALLVLLGTSAISLYIRGFLFLSDYKFAQPEFKVIPRDYFGIMWVASALMLTVSLFVNSYTFWRFALLVPAILYGLWGQLLAATRGVDALNGILTYYFLAVLFFATAIRANDPRPFHKLKRQIEDVGTTILDT